MGSSTLDAVDPGQGPLDLGDRVAPQHLDGDARQLGDAHREVLAPVVALEGQDDVGILDVVLDAHRQLELAHRLLQVAARDPVGEDRQRLSGSGRAVARALPGLPAAALLVGDVLLDVEAAVAPIPLAPPAPPAEGRRLELAGRPSGLDPADDLPGVAAHPDLGWLVLAAEGLVDGLGDRHVDRHAVALLDLHEDVEGGRRLALEHGLLGPAAARLLVGEGDRLDAAEQVVEGGVDQQVVEGHDDQGDGQLVMVRNPGQSNQSVYRVLLTENGQMTTIDDTVFPTSSAGVMLVADTGGDASSTRSPLLT